MGGVWLGGLVAGMVLYLVVDRFNWLWGMLWSVVRRDM